MKKPLTLLAVALFCVSCAPAGNTTTAPTASTSQPTASAQVSLSADSGPQAPGGTIPATIGITWDQASKDEAVDVAGKAMADFARPAVEDKWANDLARWLTPQATADYSAVDPSNIPVSRVTGTATLSVDGANGFGVMAAVPTNAGTYTVQLLRTAKDAPWKVNRLTPPSS
ncbi:hypothetical protein [Arthrobacter oryzae]|uniref:Lipoprotein n=1 Tax=Arthrobacter oryzae TaxID=409290 RepID=A0A3N0BSY4_9MICC|nr:hypothetical protein [Arthrobacter oryzae]RNL51737.1 hypothetical protein D7003_15170 [Arthrobacter oryzae]